MGSGEPPAHAAQPGHGSDPGGPLVLRVIGEGGGAGIRLCPGGRVPRSQKRPWKPPLSATELETTALRTPFQGRGAHAREGRAPGRSEPVVSGSTANKPHLHGLASQGTTSRPNGNTNTSTACFELVLVQTDRTEDGEKSEFKVRSCSMRFEWRTKSPESWLWSH